MNEIISWKKEYEVGVESIDNEHKLFVGLIQKISSAFENNEKKEHMTLLIKELYKYVDFHFFSEENIMIFTDYPDYAVQKKEHDLLKNQLTNIMMTFESEYIDQANLINFLLIWFREHTTQTDKKLGLFIQSRG